MIYPQEVVDRLNKVIEEEYPQVTKVEVGDRTSFEGVSRLVMLDRYALKDNGLKTLSIGDLVVVTLDGDSTFPARGLGYVRGIQYDNVEIDILDEYRSQLKDESEYVSGVVVRSKGEIEKPLELYYEQIARRVGGALASGEKGVKKVEEYTKKFTNEMTKLNIIPAGRVLYGAGSGSNVTYFNCFVMPFIHDSRQGISEHRKEVMEIMSRGGGVGTNGSTLRPKHAIAKDVGGRSSGAVSWLNDISNLTHLVEQGGSRRGAQMIMMADWHPDVLEFIISKMQNPKILSWLRDNSNDEDIRKLAANKLKFVPLSSDERVLLERTLANLKEGNDDLKQEIQDKLDKGGSYEVENKDFLSGANISITITDEFMKAVEKDGMYELRFPDLDNLTEEQKEFYDGHWQEIGDVREWQRLGYPVKVYKTIKAQELWNLISFCATYSAEPGIFFIDNANKMANSKAYGQNVVATNPCFHKDSLVSTEYGLMKIKDITEPLKVYSKDEKGKLCLRDASASFITKKGAKLVRVLLDNGMYIDVTPEHKLWSKSVNNYIEAKDTLGHYLGVLLRHKRGARYLGVRLNTQPREEQIMEHRFIMQVSDSSLDVHHKDGNTYNNNKNNLELCEHSEHASYTAQVDNPQTHQVRDLKGKFISTELNTPNRYADSNMYEMYTNISKSPNYNKVIAIIELEGEHDVYDIQVEGTHNLVVNGIIAHNCGEQPLAPYSVCNLAALNLANFINKETKEILYDELQETVKIMVRMQDNIIDQTPYFLDANKEQAQGERRVGLGVMGLHDLLLYAHLRYGSEKANKVVDKIFKTIAESAYKASIELAKEKGSFPFLEDREAFISTGYMKKMSQEIKDSILENGIRNSSLLTIAPTGSTGTMVGVSTGLEPYFSFKFFRSGRLGKFVEVNAKIVDEWLKYNPEHTESDLPKFFVGAMDLSPEEHINTQCTIQRWVDSSISKTVNAPKGYSVLQVQDLYEKLYKGGAKGGTVYVDGSRDSQVLSLSNEELVHDLLISDFEERVEKSTKPTEVKQEKVIGVEVGNTCPICLEGIVEDIGGCNTCTNCNAQLKCGL